MDLHGAGREAVHGAPAADDQRHGPKTVRNMAAVKAMPGITDVAVITYGVAVRGETFGQCIDALRALDVDWNPRHRRRASPTRRCWRS